MLRNTDIDQSNIRLWLLLFIWNFIALVHQNFILAQVNIHQDYGDIFIASKILSDLNIVTCPTLDTGFGTMDCDTSATPVACTYSCPSNQFFDGGDALTSTMKVTCNTSNAEWSHMSATNPLGVLPSCSGKRVKPLVDASTELDWIFTHS